MGYQQIKEYTIKKFLNYAFSLMSNSTEDSLTKLTYIAEKIPTKEIYKKKIKWIRQLFLSKHPSLKIAKRIINETNPHHRKKIIENFLVNQLLGGTIKRKEFEAKNGIYPLDLMVISPSMKCNLNCYGCYAGDYSKDGELSFDEVDSIITQAKEMGTYLIFFSGGEPFFWDGIFDIFKKHSDVNFQVYTHGGLLDEKNVEKIVEAGNVLPAISMEGYEKETDARRGKGHFKKVMRAMDLLKEAGNLFAVSYTQTKENTHIITSDEYIDFLIEKGAILIWIFTYVPIGRKPNIHLMATPEQRDFMRKRLAYFRATKPVLFIDFWNDGHLVDGCVAGGKKYIHINARGDAEPCVFCHFASDNIREKSLLEILKSPLFKEIQSRQPYNKNLYRPCMLIDNPEVGRDIALKHAKYFTHPGAESLFTVLAKDIDEYAKKYGQLADKAWNEKVNISEGKKMAS